MQRIHKVTYKFTEMHSDPHGFYNYTACFSLPLSGEYYFNSYDHIQSVGLRLRIQSVWNVSPRGLSIRSYVWAPK